MHAALCLRGRHALYAVHARLILQCAVDILARDGADDFFEAAGSPFVGAGHFELPALDVAVLGVHAEEVACKDGRFVATRTATYFEDGVTAVLRVGRNEQQLDVLFQFGQARLAGIKFLAGHVAHLGIGFVGDDVLGLVDAVQYLHVFLAGVHQVAQFLVFFRQLDVPLLVGNDCRVGNQCRYFLEAGHEAVELFQYGVVFCHLFRIILLLPQPPLNQPRQHCRKHDYACDAQYPFPGSHAILRLIGFGSKTGT